MAFWNANCQLNWINIGYHSPPSSSQQTFLSILFGLRNVKAQFRVLIKLQKSCGDSSVCILNILIRLIIIPDIPRWCYFPCVTSSLQKNNFNSRHLVQRNGSFGLVPVLPYREPQDRRIKTTTTKAIRGEPCLYSYLDDCGRWKLSVVVNVLDSSQIKSK